MSLADSSAAASRPRFGLNSLFIVFTAIAIVLAPTHWFGARYLTSAALSVALVFFCLHVYGVERRPAALVAAIVGAMIGLPLVLGIVVYSVHAFFNAVLCVPLVIFRPRRTVFAVAVVGLMVVVYGFAFTDAAAEHRRLQALRQSYPFESLAQRLEFEKRLSSPKTDADQAIRLAASVASNLDAQEQYQQRSYSRRVWMLQQLHEATYNHFEEIADLGVSRMPSLRRIVLEREPTIPLIMPYPVDIQIKSDVDELYGVHFLVLNQYADADRQGYVRNIDEVAGFEPHMLEAMPDPGESDRPPTADWQVSRLELVSLIRHEKPSVYVADTMPQMDQLTNVPTRELNEFEEYALPELYADSDIVHRSHQESIVMLGAVRAGKTCIECHEAPRGKLIGAFSYEISPIAADSQSAAHVRATE